MTLNREGSLSCHLCCNTGPRFLRSHLKNNLNSFAKLLFMNSPSKLCTFSHKLINFISTLSCIVYCLLSHYKNRKITIVSLIDSFNHAHTLYILSVREYIFLIYAACVYQYNKRNVVRKICTQMRTNFEYTDCKKWYTTCGFTWHDLIQIKTPKMGSQKNFFDLRSILMTFYLKTLYMSHMYEMKWIY